MAHIRQPGQSFPELTIRCLRLQDQQKGDQNGEWLGTLFCHFAKQSDTLLFVGILSLPFRQFNCQNWKSLDKNQLRQKVRHNGSSDLEENEGRDS